MLQANGLYGHIQRNALKSALLLTGFVALTVLFWYAWCIVYTAIFDATLLNRIARRHRTVVTVYDYLGRAADRAVSLWWVPLVLSGIWFAIAYATHAALIRVATGARPITRREQPRLYNMVETLSITAGLPMPRVEIMPTDAMNAYASGLNPDDAVVAVSSGLLDALNDDELSAVIAHELTHIKNYDVRFMVVATVFAGGLTLLGNAVAKLWSGSSSPTATEGAAYGVLVGSHDDDDDSGTFTAAAISIGIAIAFMALTHIFALLIKFAISRSREFMADAGAIELTKNSDALVSALQKISGNDEIPGLDGNLQAMMISASAERLFSTHPPITDRISALNTYAGANIDVQPRRSSRNVIRDKSTVLPAGAVGFGGQRPTFGRRRSVSA